MNSMYSRHDCELMDKINNIITYDTIGKINNERFGKYVPRNIIEPIDKLQAQADDPLFAFDDHRLEALMNVVFEKSKRFMAKFEQQCGSSDRPECFEFIDSEQLLRRNPNADMAYWTMFASDTRCLAQDFCQALLKLRG